MTWTTDKPTVPWWYWWRRSKGNGQWYVRIIELEYIGEKLWWSNIRPVSEMEAGEWSSGPLEPPRPVSLEALDSIGE